MRVVQTPIRPRTREQYSRNADIRSTIVGSNPPQCFDGWNPPMRSAAKRLVAARKEKHRTFHKSLRNMRSHLPRPSAACTPVSHSSVLFFHPSILPFLPVQKPSTAGLTFEVTKSRTVSRIRSSTSFWVLALALSWLLETCNEWSPPSTM